MALPSITRAVRAAIASAVAPLPVCSVYQFSAPSATNTNLLGGSVTSSNPNLPISVSIVAGPAFRWATGTENNYSGGAPAIPDSGVYPVVSPSTGVTLTSLTFLGAPPWSQYVAGDLFVVNPGIAAPAFRVVCDMSPFGSNLGARVWYLDDSGNPYSTTFAVGGVSYTATPIPTAATLSIDTFTSALLATDPVPPTSAASVTQYQLLYLSTGLWFTFPSD